MTVDEFIKKWRASNLKERSAAQEHFIDLCRLLGEPTPAEADPSGTSYCFERGASKTTGGEGWADVWKRGHFGWEYKGKRKDLKAAFVQLQQYALALENPPLLVVCDMERFIIQTNWTNSVSEVYELDLEDLRDANKRDLLKWAMCEPERLRPGTTREALTAKAAGEFAKLADRLRQRGHEAHTVAHFVNRLVFCMFAEDVQLLPNRMFSRMLQAAEANGDFESLAVALFSAMRTGGMVGFERVEHFNGGLFDDDETLPLDIEDIGLCRRVAALDWGEIDPSILGTLFERGLDPEKRAQLGAHYTDRDMILRIVDPVVTRPWLSRWESDKQAIKDALAKAASASGKAAQTKARGAAVAVYRGFLDDLRAFKVLDPACGSGNFLYVALRALKDLEHRAGLEAEALGLEREFPRTGPENVLGIELNPYAAELARVTVWIGEIQWMRRNGFSIPSQPVLRPLSNIECRDALLSEGRRATWPAADAIIGNPPFLGNKLLRSHLGDAYVDELFDAYRERVPGEADLVAYWVAKAWALISGGNVARAGFVTTNSIRGSSNRPVLEPIVQAHGMFEIWSDEPWIVDGAAVRVSIVCFASSAEGEMRVNGQLVDRINADLTSHLLDLTEAKKLIGNAGVAFQGPVKVGPFEVSGDVARAWLREPTNPNGRTNADVLRPWVNGRDLVRRPSGQWIVDFGGMTETEASFYEKPFEYVLKNVKPLRDQNRDVQRRTNWWKLGRSGGDVKAAIEGLDRFIATARVAKHRLFVWVPAGTLPDTRVNVIARQDDMFFGILHSRFHEAWSLRLGGWHGVGNDPQYTPSLCFETYPFPEGVIPRRPQDEELDERLVAIGLAAERLTDLRDSWLNPPELVRLEGEPVDGFPQRIVPVDAVAANLLAKRTLTALYNDRPTWLTLAHATLDAAVAAAYGWPEDISTEDALAKLMALNDLQNQSFPNV